MKKMLSFIASVIIVSSMTSGIAYADGTWLPGDGYIPEGIAVDETPKVPDLVRELIAPELTEQLKAIYEQLQPFANAQSTIFFNEGINDSILFTSTDQETVDKVKQFIAEKGIDKNSVNVSLERPEVAIVMTDIDVIEQKVKDFVTEKGYNATVSAFTDNVLVTFKQLPIGEQEYDTTAIKQEIKTFCENNSIEPSLVQVVFLVNKEGTIEDTDKTDENILITDHETIIAMLNDFIKEKQLADVIVGDDESSGKVILSYYYVHPEQEDMFKNFISEKSIDSDEITILVMEGAAEVPDKEENSLITDHETIIAMLNDFIKEKQLADVIVGDDEPSGKVILSYYYVHPEQEDMFKNFISEKSIDADEITILVMEGTGETPDKSDDSILPQTGYSNIHKAITGLAALMTVTGTALIAKSKKKDK